MLPQNQQGNTEDPTINVSGDSLFNSALQFYTWTNFVGKGLFFSNPCSGRFTITTINSLDVFLYKAYCNY